MPICWSSSEVNACANYEVERESVMSKVWLVTGSASGLGRNIAEAVLDSGDLLVATACDPQRLGTLLERYGERVRSAALDVADERAAIAAVEVAIDAFGRLDVVVNNAGFGDVAISGAQDRRTDS